LKSHTFIVIATFNGADFLSDQLKSLIDQSESNWTLLVQDDGSTDETLEILREFARKDERIRVLGQKQDCPGSAMGNFSSLLQSAYDQGAEYVFCCDQDDVWEPAKLELIMNHLKTLEGQNRAPSLVHHDLAVVGEHLEPIAGSFVERMQLSPLDESNPQRLLSRNEVTGCAMAFNRSLLEIALPVPDQAVMHDWWLALCAGFFGRLEFVPEVLVKYRQHGANTIGAKSFWHSLNPSTNWIEGWRRGDADFIATMEQCAAFRESMASRLGEEPEIESLLHDYCGLHSASRRQRLEILRARGLWRKHWFSNLILLCRMLLLPRASTK